VPHSGKRLGQQVPRRSGKCLPELPPFRRVFQYGDLQFPGHLDQSKVPSGVSSLPKRRYMGVAFLYLCHSWGQSCWKGPEGRSSPFRLPVDVPTSRWKSVCLLRACSRAFRSFRPSRRGLSGGGFPFFWSFAGPTVPGRVPGREGAGAACPALAPPGLWPTVSGPFYQHGCEPANLSWGRPPPSPSRFARPHSGPETSRDGHPTEESRPRRVN
jgi:hypothetical protein